MRMIQVAVVGPHLTGQPLNNQLTDRHARLVKTCRTSPVYRLYVLMNVQPPKPALKRISQGKGAAIEVEVWEMPMEEFGGFVALVMSPWAMGFILLDDGNLVRGLVCESYALDEARDITLYGSWRAFLSSLSK